MTEKNEIKLLLLIIYLLSYLLISEELNSIKVLSEIPSRHSPDRTGGQSLKKLNQDSNSRAWAGDVNTGSWEMDVCKLYVYKMQVTILYYSCHTLN